MQQYAPHPGSEFEGYYSKFSFPSGASLALIICSVPNALHKPHMVSITYVPPDRKPIFQRELFVEVIEMDSGKSKAIFNLCIPGIGRVKCNPDSSTEYIIECEGFSFHATAATRVPWSSHKSTPEGWLVHMPLPLHWHVHSLASNCKYSLKLTDATLPLVDTSGTATVHQEKNWGHSFPKAHIWIQARDGERGLCCAGGRVLGMQAFLLGYRSKDINLNFQPPFALKVMGWGPFMSVGIDWKNRAFSMSVQSVFRKLVVRAKAPHGSFFSLSSPFPEGHRENFLGQSFQATVEIEIFERGWTWAWESLKMDHFKEAALEFGGEYYPPAGTEQ